MAHLEFFTLDRIALHKEIKYHPKLQKQLAEADVPVSDFPQRMAIAAAYVNIALDDLYLDEDIDAICHMIVSRLQARRSLIIRVH
jgi:hypothetical protein